MLYATANVPITNICRSRRHFCHLLVDVNVACSTRSKGKSHRLQKRTCIQADGRHTLVEELNIAFVFLSFLSTVFLSVVFFVLINVGGLSLY